MPINGADLCICCFSSRLWAGGGKGLPCTQPALDFMLPSPASAWPCRPSRTVCSSSCRSSMSTSSSSAMACTESTSSILLPVLWLVDIVAACGMGLFFKTSDGCPRACCRVTIAVCSSRIFASFFTIEVKAWLEKLLNSSCFFTSSLCAFLVACSCSLRRVCNSTVLEALVGLPSSYASAGKVSLCFALAVLVFFLSPLVVTAL